MQNARTPWYRYPLVWMLIAIPMSAVVMGVTMITLAVKTDDGLVIDDYYKYGKEINRQFARDRAALAQGLEGVLAIDPAQRRVSVDMSAHDPEALPRALRLQLLHPTRAGLDQDLMLIQTGTGHYQALLSADPPPGHWRIQISGEDWRIVGRIRLPAGDSARVAPAIPEPASALAADRNA